MHTFDKDATIVQSWQGIVNVVAEALGMPSAIITRVMPPYIEVFKSSDSEGNPYQSGQKVKLAKHYCEHVVMKKEPLKLVNAHESADWCNAPEIDYGMIAYLGYPVCWPDGEVFGTICVLDNKANEYNGPHQDLLIQFQAFLESQLQLMIQTEQLRKQLDEIKVLRGLIPICAECKTIRDDAGLWHRMEEYISSHSEAMFSHTLCPTCYEKAMDEIRSHRTSD